MPLRPQVRPAVVPASYAQQRLWFLDQLGGGQSLEYHLPMAWRLRGPLDRAALAAALTAIQRRHESLRTTFAKVDDAPVQVIAPPAPVPLPFDDLQAFEPAAQAEAIREARIREAAIPFDLARGPVWRVRVLVLGPHDHILLWTPHHIVSDAWSRTVFLRELATLYAAFQAGRPDPLPPLAVQYADFALWQRQWLDDATLEQGLAYWRRQLADIPDQLMLLTDRPRPPLQTFAAAVEMTRVSPATLAVLKRTVQAQGATLYIGLLTAFAALLARYSGQDDIVIGSPMANRQDAQLEDLIGFFVNTLVLRVRVSSTQTWEALLAEVRQTTLEAYRYQDVPFERLVEELAPARRLDVPPIVQVMLTLQNVPTVPPQLAGLQIERLPLEAPTVRVDLELYVMEQAGELVLTWVYNRALFDGWRIQQMARHFTRMLEALTQDRTQRVGRARLLEVAERHEILETWNHHQAPGARDDSAGPGETRWTSPTSIDR